MAKRLIYRSQGYQRYRHRPPPGRHRSVPIAGWIHAAEHIRRQRQVQKAHHRGNANFSLRSSRGSMFPASVLRRVGRDARLNVPRGIGQNHRGDVFPRGDRLYL